MAIEEGSLVHLVAGGVDVFRVLEIGVDGDLSRALVEAVGESRPGIYPWSTDIARLVPADQPPAVETD
ncbi:hypothetical protein OG874_33410 [Nocardia sp. NBC_00565]|uniref:hypothetical protein n=1 Tax=Nocardia sp. NBC_00565 TaxID=2975993 RepID=UPI002E8136FE|nr:hypothetical protein [Nocardia sp. NBC_00565]WUC01647.1 hypothetical protein OG874_33410 [Nocardia sp. NBC_00565]